MGEPKKHPQVKLITGLIFKEDESFDKAMPILKRHFGNPDFKSPQITFDHTNHYRDEIGDGLKRIFLSFEKLIMPQDLYKIKSLTNRIEKRLSSKGARLINIDPGYVDAAKLILATTKDFKHRIYLDKGIFAEVTLSYQGNSFQPQECTYPDYRKPEYIDTFNRIRQIYLQKAKK